MNKLMRSICVLLVGIGEGQINAKGNLNIAIPKGIKYDFNVNFNLKKANKNEFTESKAIELKKEGDEAVFIGNLDLIDLSTFYFATTTTFGKARIYKKLKDDIADKIKKEKSAHANDDLYVFIDSVGGFLMGSWASTMTWNPDTGEQPAYQAALFNSTEWHLEIKFHQTIKDDNGTRTVATKDSTLFLNKKDKKKTN